MLSDIINYLEINALLGTGGQPQREQFRAIQAAGYQVVINLLPPTSRDALPDEAALVAALGMEYIAIPVRWDAPSVKDLAQFILAMRNRVGRKIFAHCAMNMRVSAFVFLYRILELGEERAVVERDLIKIWEPNPIWRAFIEERLTTDSPLG